MQFLPLAHRDQPVELCELSLVEWGRVPRSHHPVVPSRLEERQTQVCTETSLCSLRAAAVNIEVVERSFVLHIRKEEGEIF